MAVGEANNIIYPPRDDTEHKGINPEENERGIHRRRAKARPAVNNATADGQKVSTELRSNTQFPFEHLTSSFRVLNV